MPALILPGPVGKSCLQFPRAVTFVLAVAEENCNPSPCCGLGAGAGAGLLPAWPWRGTAAFFGTVAGARCAPAQGICQGLLKLPFLSRLQGGGVLAGQSNRRRPAGVVPAASSSTGNVGDAGSFTLALWPCLPMVPEVSRLRGLLEDPAPLHFRRKISGNPAPRPGMQLPRAPASPLRFPRVIHPGSTQGVPFEDIPAYETALPEDTACAYQSAPLPLAARL